MEHDQMRAERCLEEHVAKIDDFETLLFSTSYRT